MELMAGYKQTDLGVIPQDWDVKRLGDIGESLIGLTYSPRDVRSEGVLVLRSSNIQEGALSFDDCVFVQTKIPQRIMVLSGDLLICVRNGSRELIGKCVLLDERVQGMAFGAFMAVYRSAYSKYVYHQFCSQAVKRQIHAHLGATINQITNKSLNSFQVAIPPTAAERNAISEALSDADALIASLEQLIAKKRYLAEGVMQALLQPKSTWSGMTLGMLGAFIKGRGVKKDECQGGAIPCVRYGEIYTKHTNYIKAFSSWITPRVAATATRLRRGDILFAGSGETKEEIGKCVAFLDDCEAYAGGDIVILRPQGVDSLFLGYFLNTAPVNSQKASKGQGDAVVHIGSAALADITISIPPIQEQTAIATILTDIDAEIAALEAKLDKARQIKQGMMQELLTGKTRLI